MKWAFEFVYSAFLVLALTVYGEAEPFTVRQETKEFDGIWVSRPKELDEYIVFFLKTHGIQTLDDYAAWVRKNIVYQKNGGFVWPDPRDTLRLLRGDCKNFATLNAAVLRVLGFAPRIMISFSRERSHAICVFEMNGAYWWFDNARLKRTETRSLPDFVRELTRQYNLASLRPVDVI